jgi:hypothetical protein
MMLHGLLSQAENFGDLNQEARKTGGDQKIPKLGDFVAPKI